MSSVSSIRKIDVFYIIDASFHRKTYPETIADFDFDTSTMVNIF